MAHQISQYQTVANVIRRVMIFRLSNRFRNSLLLVLHFTIAGAVTAAAAQSLTVSVQVLPGAPGRLLIEGSGSPREAWSFRDTYAGIVGLGERVRGFQLFDAGGKQVAVRRIAPGQFASTEAAAKFKYEIELTATSRPADAAFTSWLGPERGLLMFGDLLPEPRPGQPEPVTVRLILSAGWNAYASDTGRQETQFEITEPDRAPVVVGKKIRAVTRAILGKPFTMLTDGDWAFTDSDAVEMAANVLQLHRDNTGQFPCESTSLVLLPFPQPTSANKWSAQTRGCTVTLLMGRSPSKVAAVSQLGLALTHELFHIWVPNGLALTGEYDWFYEGFTMYQAARAAVRLDLLSFEQFLNAISDAYDGSSIPDAPNLSLIEASKQRWTNGASTVYSKAMVVAFLYDLNLRWQTKGKRSLDDVYRTIARSYVTKSPPAAANADGNGAVVAALRAELSDQDFVNRLVVERANIDLQKELAPYGLHVEKPGVRSHIFVNAQLTSRQRDLLKQLGYNEPRSRGQK